MLKPHRPKYDVPAPPIVWELELTTGQVAALLGVCPLTISKWCKVHGLPHVKHGAHHRILLSDLRDWIRVFAAYRHEVTCQLTPTTRARIAAFIEGAR